MNEKISKLCELAKTDAAFQEKLKAAAENYKGAEKEEDIFNTVLAPLTAEYGISMTFDEFKAFQAELAEENGPLSDDEVMQVAGGKNTGMGAGACVILGIGLGLLGASLRCQRRGQK